MQHLQIIINRCLHFHSLWMLLWGDSVIHGGRGKCRLSPLPIQPLPQSFPSQPMTALSLGCSHQNPQGILNSSPSLIPQVRSVRNTYFTFRIYAEITLPGTHVATAPIIPHLDQWSCLFPSLPASAFFSLCTCGQGGRCKHLSQVTSPLHSETPHGFHLTQDKGQSSL